MKGVFNTMSHLNTGWTVIACNVVWYILHTEKSLAASIFA